MVWSSQSTMRKLHRVIQKWIKGYIFSLPYLCSTSYTEAKSQRSYRATVNRQIHKAMSLWALSLLAWLVLSPELAAARASIGVSPSIVGIPQITALYFFFMRFGSFEISSQCRNFVHGVLSVVPLLFLRQFST